MLPPTRNFAAIAAISPSILISLVQHQSLRRFNSVPPSSCCSKPHKREQRMQDRTSTAKRAPLINISRQSASQSRVKSKKAASTNSSENARTPRTNYSQGAPASLSCKAHQTVAD